MWCIKQASCIGLAMIYVSTGRTNPILFSARIFSVFSFIRRRPATRRINNSFPEFFRENITLDGERRVIFPHESVRTHTYDNRRSAIYERLTVQTSLRLKEKLFSISALRIRKCVAGKTRLCSRHAREKFSDLSATLLSTQV